MKLLIMLAFFAVIAGLLGLLFAWSVLTVASRAEDDAARLWKEAHHE